jgi:hypothetical protein
MNVIDRFFEVKQQLSLVVALTLSYIMYRAIITLYASLVRLIDFIHSRAEDLPRDWPFSRLHEDCDALRHPDEPSDPYQAPRGPGWN